jgi:type IV secretory pathway component VirB8
MKELEIYNWQEYERKKDRVRLQSAEQENSREIGKVQQANKKFSSHYGEAREEKKSEQ